jgi:hypothetical protein
MSIVSQTSLLNLIGFGYKKAEAFLIAKTIKNKT